MANDALNLMLQRRVAAREANRQAQLQQQNYTNTLQQQEAQRQQQEEYRDPYYNLTYGEFMEVRRAAKTNYYTNKTIWTTLFTPEQKELYKDFISSFQSGGYEVQTPSGYVSTAFPEKYVQQTPTYEVQTPQGGFSTAFPELYSPKEKLYNVIFDSKPIQTPQPTYSVVSAYKEPWIDKQIRIMNQVDSPFAGPLMFVRDTGETVYNVGKGVVTQGLPKTVGNIVYGGARQFKENIVEGKGYPEIGQALYNNPRSSTTYVITSLLAPSAVGRVVKYGSDILRTKGMTELPAEAIIAPEYFKGQNYPRVYRGQTAGSLLEEFKQSNLQDIYGWKSLRGLTASPTSIEKSTTILEGGSELKGLYAAPKLNPSFLKLSRTMEQRLQSFQLGLNPINNINPTSFQVKPLAYELLPGVKPSQSKFLSVKEGQEIFEQSAKPGVSYVTFIKSEKEAVIPAGTNINRIGERFYFKFNNRRIPLYEYEVVKEGTGEEASKVFGRYNRGESSNVNPLSYYNYPTTSTSYAINIKSSVINPMSSSNSLIKSSKVVNPYSSKAISKPSSSIPSYKGGYKSSFTPSSSTITPTTSSLSIASPSKTYYRPSSGSSYGTGEPPNRIVTKFPKQYYTTSKVKSLAKTLGYRTYFYSKGVKTYLPGIDERSRAIQKGETKALKSIAAKFGIEPSGYVYGKEEAYTPSKAIFRGYKIRKTSTIPLKDEWIQKAGTRREPTVKGARLATRTEVNELLGFRRRNK